MTEWLTRRVLLAGSTAAFIGCTLPRFGRERVLKGIRVGKQSGAVDIALLRDGRHAVSADRTVQGAINFWDLSARRIERSFSTGRRVWSFAVDEDRGVLAVASWETAGRSFVGLFDLATGRQLRQLDGGRSFDGVHCLLVAREGLLTSFVDRGQRLESALWSFETGRQLAWFGRPAEAIAVDRRTILGGPVIWDLIDGRTRGELRLGTTIWGCAISADGRRAVSDRGTRGILWNDRGEVVDTFDDQPMTTVCAAFSPDDRFLITARYPESFRGDGRLLVLRDARTGRLLAELPGHARVVKGIAFSRDGSLAVSAGLNGELMLWTMPSEKL